MARGGLSVRLIESDEEFAALREQWDLLLSNSDANTVFLTWEWLYTWRQHFKTNRQLAIMLVERDGELLGIAPLYYDRERVRGLLPMNCLQWLGSGKIGSDYLNLIAKAGFEREVCAAVVKEISRERGQWDLLRLTGFLEGSVTYRNLLDGFSADRSFNFRSEQTFICPYISIKEHTWDSLLEGFGDNMRRNLQRYSKQLFQKLGAAVELCRREEDIKRFLDAIFDLHSNRFQPQTAEDDFAGRTIRAFHQEAAKKLFAKGWLRLYLLTIDERPVAGLYSLEYNDAVSLYQSGFDPEWSRYSPLTVLIGHAIKEAIAHNLSIVDFLHGDEAYKFKWTDTVRRTLSIMVYPRRRIAPNCYFFLRNLRNKWQERRLNPQTANM